MVLCPFNLEMALLLFAWLATLAFINILVHSLGMRLLFCLYREDDKVNTLLLIYLSATEIFGNVCCLFIDVLQVIEQSLSSDKFHAVKIAQEYICTIKSSTFLFVYYMVMVYIMVEKFLDIRLDLKYPLYCKLDKVNNLMSVTWFVGWMACIALILVNQVGGIDYYMWMLKFIYPTFDVGVLLTIVVCYSYVFTKFKEKLISDRARQKHKTNIFKMVIRSHFCMSLLRALTFICLVMIPDVVYMVSVVQNNVVKAPSPPILILYHISCVSDAVIYVFMHPEVRKFVTKAMMSRVYGTACERGSVFEGVKRNISLSCGGKLHVGSLSALKTDLTKVLRSSEKNRMLENYSCVF